MGGEAEPVVDRRHSSDETSLFAVFVPACVYFGESTLHLRTFTVSDGGKSLNAISVIHSCLS